MSADGTQDPSITIWSIPSTPTLSEHAKLCLHYSGWRATDIAVDMGWVDADTAKRVVEKLNGGSNTIREINALVSASRGLDRHRQRLFGITESIIYLESLREDGVEPHTDLSDPEIFSACERHNAILMSINGTPVLFFGERESGMRSFSQIAGVDRANDPLRQRYPNLLFGLSRNDEVIALRSGTTSREAADTRPRDQDSDDKVLHDASMRRLGVDALRKLADMHDLALTHDASDIHITVTNEGVPLVTYRVLGDNTPMPIQITLTEYVEIVQFLTKRSGAVIRYEYIREPKDGMYQYIGTSRSKKAYVRCSFIPAGHSDGPGRQLISICLRMIPEETGSVVLSEKGVREDVIASLRRAVTPDSGIVLLVGPTGSGKSTTIAGTIDLHRALHGDTKTRLSIEDPVERFLPGIEQFQVPYHLRGTSEGFALYLRGFLRHDPNVLNVGEIRDEVTAKVSIQAASTGHLVISTLHADSAYKTVQRLTDMIPAEDRSMRAAMVDNLSLIVAQRLVKKLCSNCSVPTPPGERERDHVEYVNRMKGVSLEIPETARDRSEEGCKACNYTGYAGRLPVNEVLEITEEVKQIFRNPDPIEQNALIKEALSLRMEDCIMDAVRDGLTPLRSLEV